MKKEIVQTELAPQAVGTYSQGVRFGNVIYFSGQIGLSVKNSELKNSFDEQLEQILANIDGLLKSQNIARENIIKTTIFMLDLAHFSKVNAAYEKFFNPPFPARSTVQVSGLPKGAQIEIEVIAAV